MSSSRLTDHDLGKLVAAYLANHKITLASLIAIVPDAAAYLVKTKFFEGIDYFKTWLSAKSDEPNSQVTNFHKVIVNLDPANLNKLLAYLDYRSMVNIISADNNLNELSGTNYRYSLEAHFPICYESLMKSFSQLCYVRANTAQWLDHSTGLTLLYYKKIVLAYIYSLPLEERVKLYRIASNNDTNLGDFFSTPDFILDQGYLLKPEIANKLKNDYMDYLKVTSARKDLTQEGGNLFVRVLKFNFSRLSKDDLLQIISNSKSSNYIYLNRLLRSSSGDIINTLFENFDEDVILAFVNTLTPDNVKYMIECHDRDFFKIPLDRVYISIINKLAEVKVVRSSMSLLEEVFSRDKIRSLSYTLSDEVFAFLISKLDESIITNRAAIVGWTGNEEKITHDLLRVNFTRALSKGPLSILALVKRTDNLNWIGQQYEDSSYFHHMRACGKDELISILSKLNFITLLNICVLDSKLKIIPNLQRTEPEIYAALRTCAGQTIYQEIRKKSDALAKLDLTYLNIVKKILLDDYIPSLPILKQQAILREARDQSAILYKILSYPSSVMAFMASSDAQTIDKVHSMSNEVNKKLNEMKFILIIFNKISGMKPYTEIEKIVAIAKLKPASLEAACLNMAEQIRLSTVSNSASYLVSLGDAAKAAISDNEAVKASVMANYPDFYELCKKMTSTAAARSTLFSEQPASDVLSVAQEDVLTKHITPKDL